MNRSVARGVVLVLFAAVLIVALILMPIAKPKQHPANLDPWKLVSYDPNNPYGTYLGNGFISTRIMGDGVGSQNGQPLPCFMVGLYNNEKLISTPTWSDLRFYDGKTQFRLDKDADYKQMLDMKTGILTTEATWRAGRKSLTGKIEVIVSRAEQNVALVRATLVPDFDGSVRFQKDQRSLGGFKQLAEGDTATIHDLRRKSRSIKVSGYHTQNGPFKLYLAGASIYSKVGCSEITVSEGRQYRVDNWSMLVLSQSTDSWGANLFSMVERFVNAINAPEKFISAHKAAWAKLWKKDIIIDGPAKDQQALHSCMFYLLQSVREGSQWSIPPMGLSEADFSGHVFWDADLWMFPALILQHPELAKAIVDYRYNTLPGAMANAKEAGYAGAQYAWESGYTGKEDTPPGLVYRNERHINGDIAISQWQYYLATGDLAWLKSRGYPVLKATADYWASRAKFVPQKNRYEILQVVPPDENAELVNNSAYTNAITKMNLQIAMQAAKLTKSKPNPQWADVAQKMFIPYDPKAKRFIAFDGYWGATSKQADTEMLAYPLQYQIPGQDMTGIYRNTYNYYAPKVHKNGPAMISSVHSVIASRLGDRENAYASFVKSYKPYLRGPFNYFNEKASVTWKHMCFLTGAAGPIQASLFGLTGARMEYFPTDRENPELQFKPCLPKQWKSMKVTGIEWRGKTFDVTVSKGDKIKIARQ